MKYTNADEKYYLSIKLKGEFTVSLVHYYVECGGVIKYNVVSKQDVISSNEKEFLFEYVTNNPFGCLSFVLEGKKDGSEFIEAAYVSDVSDPIKDVRLAIGICTFKREEYVERNLRNIMEYLLDNPKSELFDNLEIFVADNAHTLKERNKIPDSKHIHLVENKNSGGSGGFTRCMCEAIFYNEKNSDKKITNLILMDDDVKFDPYAIEKTYKILSLIKDEYIDSFVGGAMFKMGSPLVQHASGEFWHGDRCESFVETFNSNRSMDDLKNILENELFTKANYQAWWYCAIPMMHIRKDNLPLPFFIKSDDIEFSIRNLKNLILVNGINVWHESFESKYSAQNEYYTVRNYLVAMSVHNIPVTKERIILLLKSYFKHYVCNYKYLEIEHFCNAINDFLKGVDYLKNIDLEKYHKGIMSKGYKMVDKNNLPVTFTDDQYYNDIGNKTTFTGLKKKLAKFTVNGLFLPAKDYAVLGMWGGTYEQTYRKKFLVRYEINSQKGFVLYRNRKAFFKAFSLLRKTKKNIIKNYDRVKKEFADRWQEIVNLETWTKNM